MEASYGHLLAMGVGWDHIVQALAGDPAYLVAFEDATAVFSQAAAVDSGTTALEVSGLTSGAILGFEVVDDKSLGCVLCRRGETIAEVTVPTIEEFASIDADELELMAEWLDEAVPTDDSVTDALGFASGVGTGDLRRALAVLNDDYRDDEQVSATTRHVELLAALDLPTAIAGWDFYRFDGGPDAHQFSIDPFEGPTPIRVN